MKISVTLRHLFVYIVEEYAVWSLRRYMRRHPSQDIVSS